jgi:hypothetical protein
LQFQTRCVHNLAIDWLDENYIASCQPIESTVCVWDRRVGARLVSPSVGSAAGSPDSNQSIAALQFKNVFDSKSSIWSLRFSKTTRGYLGALSSTGHFKTFEIAKDYQSEEYRASIDETFGQGSFKNYPEPVYTRNIRDVCLPFDHPTRGCEEKDRVVTFDFLNLNMSPQPSAIALDGHGQPRIVTARPPCAPVSLSSRGMLAFGIASGDSDFRTIHPLSEHVSPISGLVENIRARVLSSSKYSSTDGDKNSDESRGLNTEPISSREMRERAMSLGTLGVLLTAKEALTLSTIAQSRCREGYLFNEARNRRIVKDDPALQDLWTWIQRKSEDYEYLRSISANRSSGAHSDSLGTTMVVNGLDMNYVGVSNVWTNDMGLSSLAYISEIPTDCHYRS